MKLSKNRLAELLEDYFEHMAGCKAISGEGAAKYVKKHLNNAVDRRDTVVKVIEYFNEKTGKKFRAKASTANGEIILSRMNEGYKFCDFKQVIDNKVEAWADDEKMSRYLRPQTLFAYSHFEEYLNEVPVNTGPQRKEHI